MDTYTDYAFVYAFLSLAYFNKKHLVFCRLQGMLHNGENQMVLWFFM